MLKKTDPPLEGVRRVVEGRENEVKIQLTYRTYMVASK